MSFGSRVKELRQERKLTQEQLAREIGVDKSYISKMETDHLEHTPSIKTIVALAEALEVDELELMSLADKVPPLFETIASDENAVRFFRRATKVIKTSEGWRDLLDYLESQEKQE